MYYTAKRVASFPPKLMHSRHNIIFDVHVLYTENDSASK